MKRSASKDLDEQNSSKRMRASYLCDGLLSEDTVTPAAHARLTLQRSICIALKQKGYDSCTSDALECVTNRVESCASHHGFLG